MTALPRDTALVAAGVAGMDALAQLDPVERLLLDEAALAVREPADAGDVAPRGAERLVVIGDASGQLARAAAERFGAADVRVFHDGLDAEQRADAFERMRARDARDAPIRRHGLDAELVRDATLVIARLPKHLAELEELVSLVASFAADDVRFVAADRVKHMSRGQNEVLARGFERVRASLGRQKSRALHASGPRRDHGIAPFPRWARVPELDVDVAAHGGAFAGPRLDIGTRALIASLETALTAAGIGPESEGVAVDLGCGTGLIAIATAHARSRMRIVASDRSWAACASAAATIDRAGLGSRIEVIRDAAAGSLPAHSADLVLLNPPFHSGHGLDDEAATPLFVAAARILKPGASLVTVFNTHLPHRTVLRRTVGPTEQLARTPKFTITRSVAASPARQPAVPIRRRA